MPELIPAEPGTLEWLAARRQGVTATDIVTILGLSHWDSVYSLFWRKMGQVPDEPDRDRLALGRALEPYVIERWAEEHPGKFLSGGALWRSDTRAWQLATLDKAVWTGEHGGPLEGVLEVKTWADADRHSWQDGPPAQVRAQVLWQMDVMGVAVGHVGVVFLPSGRFGSYTIEHSCPPDGVPAEPCDVCSDTLMMRDAGHDFMARLRLELPPPDPDASAATLAAVRARFTGLSFRPAKQAEVDGQLYDAWSEARDVIKRWEDTARSYEIRLREQAGEAAEYTVGGELVARRVVSDAGDRIERVEAGHA